MRVVSSVLVACLVVVSRAAVLGVPSSKQELYEGDTFSCDSSSKQIPNSRVNDDYCDCKDGSDEPGTSACANGRFYCINKGFRGKTIPASIVNDGVCDCCDGSDEYNSPTQCANTCDADGAEWRQHQAERIRQAEEGAIKKKEYIEQGQKETAERAAKIEDLKRKKDETAAKRDAAETAKTTAEEAEASERKRLAASRDHEVMEGLGLGEATAEELRSVLLRFARDSSQGEKLAEVARAWHTDRSASESESDRPATPVAIAEVSWKDDELSAKANGYKSEEADRLRDEFRMTQEEARDADRQLTDAESASKHDYGPSSEFAPLRGRCIEKKVQKYTYKVCPYDRSSQDGTSLGTFSGWEGGEHRVMLFTNGQHCYQGPNRSMTVTLECGVDEELLGVSEPSKCAYSAILRTPAACDEKYADDLRLQLEDGGVSAGHDEL